MSATADAKHLVFHRWAGQTNVSVASFENNGTRLGPLKRLTLNDNYNNPLDWTADGRAVILASNRNGSWGLFQHSRDSDAIASLVNAYNAAKLLRQLSDKVITSDNEPNIAEIRDWLSSIRESSDHHERMELAVMLREIAERGDAERQLCRELLDAILRFSSSKDEVSYLSY